MTITTTPLRDLVLCRLRPLPEQTGGIIRVSRFESSRWADVLAVGPECRDTTVGDGVLVNPLIGTVIGNDLMLPEGSILSYDWDGERTPARGLCLVQKAETEEKVGSIILTQNARDEMASYQVQVLDIGGIDLCDDIDHCERPHGTVAFLLGDRSEKEWWPHLPDPNLVVGAWCVVKHRSFIPSDDPHGKTFYVRQDDVLAVLSVDSGGS